MHLEEANWVLVVSQGKHFTERELITDGIVCRTQSTELCPSRIPGAEWIPWLVLEPPLPPPPS